MSDLDKLFENAPEGAVELCEHEQVGHLRWFDKEGKAWCGENWVVSEFKKWKTIATRPQPERKTVEDAVAGKWVIPFGMDTLSDKRCLVGYNYEKGVFFTCERDYIFTDGEESLVCTREEFEACVAAKAAKSEPEWTHEYRLGDSPNWFPCSIVTEVGTQGVVIKCNVFEGVQYCSYAGNQPIELKPIKPTITKAEHEFLCKFSADVNDIHVVNAVESYLAKHEVME